MQPEYQSLSRHNRTANEYVVVGLVALAGLTVSLYLYFTASAWHTNKQRIEFESRAQGHAHAVTQSLNEYLNVLYFIGDFYKFSESTSTENFEEITRSPLERYPGIQAIGWDRLVTHSERPALEQAARASGMTHFQITERNENGEIIPAQVRDEYVTVLRIAPLARNESALGFDIASNPTRKRTIDQAFKTGKVAVTERLNLVQETQSQYGVLVLLPIYESGKALDSESDRIQHRRGLVVEVLRIGDVIQHALGKPSPDGLRCELYCNPDGKANSRLFPSPSDAAPPAGDTDLSWQHKFPFANNTWCLNIEPSPEYLAANHTQQPMIILCIALLLTGVLTMHLSRRQAHIADITQHIFREREINAELESEVVERRNTQKRLQQLNDYLDTILLNLPVGVSIFEGEFLKYFHINQKMEQFTGLSANDVIGKPASGIHQNESDHLASDLAQVYQTHTPIIARETTHPNKADSTLRHYIEWLIPIHSSSGSVFAVAVVTADATELTETQQQLRQSQKMDALGTLAGGIAHDFNNILNIIGAHAQLAEMRTEDDVELQADLNAIQNASDRATKLVRQILAFSRMETTKLEPLDLVGVTNEALGLVRAATPRGVEITTDFAVKQACILGDATQIQQIIINLCTNAQHAIQGESGQIDLRIDLCNSSDVEGSHFPEDLDTCVKLTVRDNGHGISPAILSKIFDPFFTTKMVGKGTGLGLAVVHGIVEKHNGHIEVESIEGEGTSVCVYFSTTAIRPIETVNKLTTEKIGSAHVLAVDDEEQIQFVYKRILERHGYQVTVCSNGQEAWETFQKSPHRFDVVLTDQSMPKMSGKTLCGKVKELRPDIPIVMATGYSETFSEEDAIELGIHTYLLKPSSIAEVQSAIASAVDNS